MTKEEFLNRLKDQLGDMDNDEIEKMINCCKEFIYSNIKDGLLEKDVIESLGSIDKIVSEIKTDNIIIKLDSNKDEGLNENLGKKILWIILFILGFPLYLYISFLFLCGGCSLILCGIFLIFMDFFLGIGLIGIGFLFVGLSVILVKWMINLIKKIFKVKK